MFNEETQSVSQFDAQAEISNVDLIQSSTVEVTSVVTVADSKASKRLNVTTLTAQLSKIDRYQIENTAPIVFKQLFAEFERVSALYKEVTANL